MEQVTIVEDYAYAALKRAVFESMEDGNGTVSAYIPAPEFQGILAFGADLHECATELYATLQDWVRVSLEHGYQLPVVDGIDLNTEASQILATYHPDSSSPAGEFYEDEDELEAAFARHSKSP